jgi:ribonucleoside-diphosphate reductase alpha chain
MTMISDAPAARIPGSTPHRAGLRIPRRWTTPGIDPLDQVAWDRRRTVITNPDGSVVFQMDNVEVPTAWSQLATDIVVSKYFRKAGLKSAPGHETSVRQVVRRIARTVRGWGELEGGYFASAEDAQAFEAELSYMLVNQIGAFNSPVWFNLGLWHEYGIGGSGGNFFFDPLTGSVSVTADSYTRPQVSACFIQSLGDDLMSIFELARNEARVFKYGSGTGTNFSKLRGNMEKLSGGGTSSGLMSFLEVLDKGAGATKSGGTTRRAAKMVVLDLDHPEILDFIRWKVREERKVAALVAAGYSSDFNGEAYATVSGQNSNNSIRVPDRFLQSLLAGGEWQTTMRTTGAVHRTYKSTELWREIAESAWACADPGVQYDDTIQQWHTCKATDRINATNPCSEFVFLDDTACNLASINLLKFRRTDGQFDLDGYRHANRVFFLAQEILVGLASYPTERIAQRSYEFRPLGLGYANLGTLLMVNGLPYDGEEARAYAACLTALMTGEAYALSAEMAASIGPFECYPENRDSMLEVMEKHRKAAGAIDASVAPRALREAAIECWDRAVALGRLHGYRNAQASVLAPTGTIGLLMDCDTTGVEPDFALVKFKKLAGGGYFKIVNQSVTAALETLGYDDPAVERIVRYAVGTGTFDGAPHVNRDTLRQKGLTETEIDKLEGWLPSMLTLKQAFGPGMVGAETLGRLGIGAEVSAKMGWNLLAHLGFTESQIAEADAVVCGTQTVEGAADLQPGHLPVFDCANRCGPRGTRFIQPMGHVRMMSAVQPFISGAISKTVNLPHESTVEDVAEIYLEGWKLGLKAIALYRDGSKISQVLDSGGKKEKVAEAPVAAAAPAPTPELKPERGTPPPATRRYRLASRRAGITQEARIAGNKLFVRTGLYDDGKTVGELFIDMHKEGAAFRSLLNCFAIAVSMGLQYGVPLEDFVNQFVFTRFEPQGRVEGDDNIKAATSVIDYVFRVLGYQVLGREDLVHIVGENLKGREVPLPVVATPGNGHAPGNGHTPATDRLRPASAGALAALGSDALLEEAMGDAPPCSSCGHITVRGGTCYKCLNCGTSMGCS